MHFSTDKRYSLSGSLVESEQNKRSKNLIYWIRLKRPKKNNQFGSISNVIRHHLKLNILNAKFVFNSEADKIEAKKWEKKIRYLIKHSMISLLRDSRFSFICIRIRVAGCSGENMKIHVINLICFENSKKKVNERIWLIYRWNLKFRRAFFAIFRTFRVFRCLFLFAKELHKFSQLITAKHLWAQFLFVKNFKLHFFFFFVVVHLQSQNHGKKDTSLKQRTSYEMERIGQNINIRIGRKLNLEWRTSQSVFLWQIKMLTSYTYDLALEWWNEQTRKCFAIFVSREPIWSRRG